ncbi:MAG TPA: hypothetical protein VFX44_10285 [Solirubrobacterales bacterium]|nr:hypothetical protein [Solirubrobacterales bacterium]
MEALLEKEGKVERWNDDRLDELSRRMDNGFKEMRDGFARVDREMKEGFAQVNDRLDRQNHTLLVGALGVIAALIANGIFG